MNLCELFQLQHDLDIRILEEHNLRDESVFSEKILALQVEVSELANETRCFKYWSNKGPSPKSRILEEFVDCLHFILSIGISMGFDKDFSCIDIHCKDDNSDLTKMFINLYIDINDFVVCSTIDNYKTLFEDFLCIGFHLGFTCEEIENAYYEKNVINHQRQANGY